MVFIAWLYIHTYSVQYSRFHSCNFLTAPSKIINISLTKTVTEKGPALRVTWSTPQSDVMISQYQVQYKNGTTSWSTAANISVGTVSSTILIGLNSSTDYNVRVRAVSNVGVGNWSGHQTERTYNR